MAIHLYKFFQLRRVISENLKIILTLSKIEMTLYMCDIF